MKFRHGYLGKLGEIDVIVTNRRPKIKSKVYGSKKQSKRSKPVSA